MTFSNKVKNELMKTEYLEEHCRRSLLYGLCIFAKEFSYSSFLFQSENEDVVYLVKKLLLEIFGITSIIIKTETGKKIKLKIKRREEIQKLFSSFGHSRTDKSLRINFSNFQCEACSNAFFAGAFLACGNISDPSKNYHLEFTIPFLNLTDSFKIFLEELELTPKEVIRRGYHIIYFKVSEEIEQALYRMGATSSMFDLVNIKIEKDLRNQVNRYTNYEKANIERMAKAIAPQIEAIEFIINEKGKDYFPENLKYTALLRRENPDASLSELSDMSEPKISKSGINHRLKKIIEIADELRKEKGL